MKFLSLSWQQLHKDTFTLAKKIEDSRQKFDLIVAIARGGMTVAQILSDFLSLPVATFTVSSYKDLRQEKSSEVSFHVGGGLKNKRILLVDDVSDTGKTFERGVEYLHKLGATSVATASLLVKPQSKYVPDFFVKKTSAWIVFPYEVKETIFSVKKMMEKENRTIGEIKEKLKELKIPEKFVRNYLVI